MTVRITSKPPGVGRVRRVPEQPARKRRRSGRPEGRPEQATGRRDQAAPTKRDGKLDEYV